MADSTVRLFLGDSASYLHSALTGWVPDDRSFLYGWMIGVTAVPLHSLQSLLLLQTMFGVLSALMLYGWLRIGFGVSTRVATGAAVLLALDPSQLLYERMVMAEATGFLALVAFFGCASVYVRQGAWHWMGSMVLFGITAVSMRLSVLPVVLALGVLAPVVRYAFGDKPATSTRSNRLLLGAIHVLVAVVVTVGVHDLYKRWSGHLSQSKPDYTAQSGVFRLGLVLPLVKPEHLAASGIDPRMLDEVRLDVSDPRAREAHLWTSDGFLASLRRHTAQPYKAAGKISIRAIRDDPFGLIRLGIATVSDYADAGVTTPRLQNDLGRIPTPPALAAKLRDAFDHDTTGIAYSDTPATRWYTLGAPVLVLFLFALAPLALLTLGVRWKAPSRDLRVLLCLMSLGMVAQHVLFSHIVSFRYLHPLPWFVLANLAALFARPPLVARSVAHE